MLFTYLLYHQSCHDGYMAVTLAYDWYLSHDTENRTVYFIDVNPNNLTEVIKCLKNKIYLDSQTYKVEILSFDVAYKLEDYQTLKTAFPNIPVLIYDHHKSTLVQLESVKDQLGVCLDMHQSGAGLAHSYYFRDQPMPLLARLIQDRDLWLYQVPRSRELTATLYTDLKWDYTSETQNYQRSNGSILTLASPWIGIRIPEFSKWMKYLKTEDWVEDCYRKGTEKIRITDQMIQLMILGLQTRQIQGHKVALCQACIYGSELGEFLYTQKQDQEYKYDYVAMWTYLWDKGMVKVSLRSLASREIDVSLIAETMGGGGHAPAAGFEVPVAKFLDWINI